MAVSVECQSEWLTTKSKVITTNYRWVIPNFAGLFQGNSKIHEGPVISASGAKYKTSWKLQMVLNKDGFLCVDVKQCTLDNYDRVSAVPRSQSQIFLTVRICPDDDAKESCKESTEMPNCFYAVGDGLSWRLIRRDILLQDTHRYLVDDKLIVLCTLRWLEPGTHKADQLKEPTPIVPPSEIVSWMEDLYTEGEFSDVVVVAEGRNFPVHRAVLAQRSDVFRAMFNAKMTERQKNSVTIEDMSADVVSNLLTFIYTDSAPDIDTFASELLVAAEKYNIPRLKAVCEAEMAKRLDIDNVIDVLIQSEMYKAWQLKDAALHWIALHAPDVVEMESWKDLCKNHPELVKDTCEEFALYIEELKSSVMQ